MELSKRLQTVAGAVTAGNRMADIGTDHGYVPIYLLKEKSCPGAVAMDVNRGPLQRAEEHIRKEGLLDRISLRLSDGLKELRPEETDTVVIAGMGGELICRILNDAPAFLEAGKELVLQPQSEWFKVRHFLHDQAYGIEKEWFLKEDGKYYLVLKAQPDEKAQREVHMTEPRPYPEETDYRYGYHLIRERNPVLQEYLLREKEKKNKIIREMEDLGREGVKRYPVLKKEVEEIDRVLDAMTG